MSKIPYIQLKDLCTVNQGLQIPISKRFKSNGENRYFYITVQFLKESHNEKHYVENPPKSSICKEDDIIVVRTGSTGKILTGIKGCFHNNFFKVNYDKKKVVGKYLYYCLKSKEKQKEMKNRSGITTIPDLNHFMFLDMKIPLPSYSNQLKIVEVLDNINSKIEINNKINAELEAMAKTLYDYWFVQFDFPDKNGKPYKSSEGKMIFNEELKREIPVGWGSGTFETFSTIIGGSTPSKSITENFTKEVNMSWITPKDLSLNKGKKFITRGEWDVTNFGIKSASLKIMPKGTVLLSSRAPIGYLAISRKEVTTNQGFKSFVPKENYSSEFIYYSVKNQIPKIEAYSSGSTFKEVSLSVLKTIKISIPNKNILEKYYKISKPIFKEQNLLELENQKLSELRDWLLPMLMNGQVSVGEK